MVPEWMHNGPSLWAEMDEYWCNIESHPAAFMCQQQSKLHKILEILCGLTYASSSYVRVRTHSTHMHTIFNACTSHIQYRLCRSFISPLHPPPPLMWDTLESEEYSPGEWNRVDLCSFSLEELSHWSPLRLLLSPSLFCCLQSLAPSLHHLPHSLISICPSTNINYKHLFSSSRTKVINPSAVHITLCSFHHSCTSSTTITSYPSPTAHLTHFIKEPFRMLL